MRVRALVSSAVLSLVVLSSVAPQAAGPSDTLVLTLTGSGQILVPVIVNGSGPHLFVLDTGANRSVLSDALATRLSLEPVATTEMVTSSGSSHAPVVRLMAVALGSHHATDVLAPVVPEGRLRAIHAKADGIIGQDVLIDAHYTLDYRRSRLTWLDADTGSGGGTRLALRRAEGRLLVELPQAPRADETAWFVPDSGASTLVLFLHGGRAAISATPLGATVRAATITGDGQVQAAIVPKLKIGSGTFWDQPAVLVAGPDTAAGTDRVDGLLPLSRFSSVTFNGPQHYLVVR